MCTDRRFQPIAATFEDSYLRYHGGGLVAVILRIADSWSRRWRGH
jgi:hypothetical protein